MGRKPLFITDNFGKEGFKPLLKDSDSVGRLFILDPFLGDRPTAMGHRWRNLLKLVMVPFQVVKLRQQLRRLRRPFVFAHSTYYAFLASFCGVPYCATPQGSEVLVRPAGSRLYRYLLNRSARHATFVTVDSAAMAAGIHRLAGIQSHVVQNGIDVARIAAKADSAPRTLVLSVRGISDNYRIREIIAGRNASAPSVALTFSFPFVEEGYAREVEAILGKDDFMHRDVPKEDLYGLFRRAICVLSIPKSDSSPRTVYEAIFCGAIAVCAPSPFIGKLPQCMRERIVIADLSDPGWFQKCLSRASQMVLTPFVPDPEAIDQFDQVASMRRCLELAVAGVGGSAPAGVVHS
jgi:hypothetical protein